MTIIPNNRVKRSWDTRIEPTKAALEYELAAQQARRQQDDAARTAGREPMTEEKNDMPLLSEDEVADARLETAIRDMAKHAVHLDAYRRGFLINALKALDEREPDTSDYDRAVELVTLLAPIVAAQVAKPSPLPPIPPMQGPWRPLHSQRITAEAQRAQYTPGGDIVCWGRGGNVDFEVIIPAALVRGLRPNAAADDGPNYPDNGGDNGDDLKMPLLTDEQRLESDRPKSKVFKIELSGAPQVPQVRGQLVNIVRDPDNGNLWFDIWIEVAGAHVRVVRHAVILEHDLLAASREGRKT